jgi:hypothetical protein
VNRVQKPIVSKGITEAKAEKMKSIAKFVSMAMGLFLVGSVTAAPQDLYPIAETAGTFPLFQCVKYTDTHEMSPCAVTKIIAVNDPCACNDPCNCCGPKCVYIQICVPACACERVSSRRHGDRVRYDYGKYAVDVRVKKGYIEVDYQD